MQGSGTSSIRRFWHRLESKVHPDDAQYFEDNPHTFNLDFPPPAFFGDVDNAPVVILMANGGYSAATGPEEFPDSADCREHREHLWGKRTELPQHCSKYYLRGGMREWIETGSAVIVNAIAYRSSSISKERNNQELATKLPSGRIHKQWLREEVLPAAERGSRLVIAHRSKLWDFPERKPHKLRNVQYSRCPASPYLSNDLKQHVRDWLAENRFSY